MRNLGCLVVDFDQKFSQSAVTPMFMENEWNCLFQSVRYILKDAGAVVEFAFHANKSSGTKGVSRIDTSAVEKLVDENFQSSLPQFSEMSDRSDIV